MYTSLRHLRTITAQMVLTTLVTTALSVPPLSVRAQSMDDSDNVQTAIGTLLSQRSVTELAEIIALLERIFAILAAPSDTAAVAERSAPSAPSSATAATTTGNADFSPTHETESDTDARTTTNNAVSDDVDTPHESDNVLAGSEVDRFTVILTDDTAEVTAYLKNGNDNRVDFDTIDRDRVIERLAERYNLASNDVETMTTFKGE